MHLVHKYILINVCVFICAYCYYYLLSYIFIFSYLVTSIEEPLVSLCLREGFFFVFKYFMVIKCLSPIKKMVINCLFLIKKKSYWRAIDMLFNVNLVVFQGCR